MKLKKIIIAVTKNGSDLAKKLAVQWEADVKIPRRFTSETEFQFGYDGPVASEIQKAFNVYQVVVLIMAAGIAVRSIAPALDSKLKDPAVIVIDEAGKFVISLLSGHWGGANSLAQEIAGYTGGTAVITTASDLNNLPSLDVVAKKYGLLIDRPELLPRFSGAVVNGDQVVIWDQWGLRERWPENIRVENGVQPVLAEAEKLLVMVGYQEPTGLPYDVTVLALRPRCLVVGIGCCQGVPGTRIIGAIRRYCRERHWSTRSIQSLATIDLKAKEPGLLEAARELGVELQVFSKEELETAMAGLEKSGFVEATTGVGGVCEPAAILGSKRGKLIGNKMNLNQITVAVALSGEPLRS